MSRRTMSAKYRNVFGRLPVAGTALLLAVGWAVAGTGTIRIKKLRFDPLAGPPPLSRELRYEASDHVPYHIVQFNGRITPGMKQALEATGATILYYVPEDAYLVRAETKALDESRRLESVRWVGPYEPGYKLSETLGLEPGGTPGRTTGRASVEDPSALVPVLLLMGEPDSIPAARERLERAGVKRLAGLNSGRILRGEVPRGEIVRIARDPEVLWIDKYTPVHVLNDAARWVIQSGDTITFATPLHDRGLAGQGQIITLADTGIDVRHQAFSSPGKVTAYYSPQLCGPEGDQPCGDDHDQGVNHGDYTAGIAGGDGGGVGSYDGSPDQSSGIAGPHDGQAYRATLEMQDISVDQEGQTGVEVPANPSTLFGAARDRGSFIHSDSIGSCCEDYDSRPLLMDDFLFHNRDFIAVFAAGNGGWEGFTRSLSILATAKNIITVGGSQNGLALEKVYCAGALNCSSRGPTPDGRLKPDVLAPGQGVWSVHTCQSNDDPSAFCNDYQIGNGTSAAAPMVSGLAALMREYFMEGWYPGGLPAQGNGFTASSALIKASIVNSGREITGRGTCIQGIGAGNDCDVDADCQGTICAGTSGYGWANQSGIPPSREEFYPNNSQGWGRVLADDTLYFQGDTRGLFLDDNRWGLEIGESHSYEVAVGAATTPFEATLVWTDAPPLPGAPTKLVNDLNLVVVAPDGTTTYRGNRLTGHAYAESDPSLTSPDTLNNVEGVLVRTGVQTGVYNVRVEGANVPIGADSGPRQPYALVVTGGIARSRGVLNLDRTEYVPGAPDYPHIELIDPDLNVNPAAVETVTVQASSVLLHDLEFVVLTETGPNTARFTGSIQLRAAASRFSGNARLDVRQIDTIRVTYADAVDGLGGSSSVVVSAAVDWGQGHPPEEITALDSCFDGLDNDGDGVADADCALDLYPDRQQLVDGSVTAGSLASIASGSPNQSYEDLTETGGLPAKLTAIWEFNPYVGAVGVLYDLRVEGFRPTASPNDQFLFSAIASSTPSQCSPTDPAWSSAPTALTLTKTADNDQTQTATLREWAASLCVRALDSNRATSGGSKDQRPDILRLDGLFLFPSPIAIADHASAADRGTVDPTTSYLDTQTNNSIPEILTESGSRLVHTWRVTGVPAGTSHKIRLKGHSYGNGVMDAFKFYWSTSPSSWSATNPTTGFTLIQNALIGAVEQPVDFTIPAASFPGGVVYIRVIDAQYKNTGSSNSSLALDHLAIRTVP